MPRFRRPCQSNPKRYPFRPHSGGEIHRQSLLVAVCGLLSAFVRPMLRTPSDIATCPSKSDKWFFEKSPIEKQRSSREIRRFLRMVSSTFATVSLQVEGFPLGFSSWISVRPNGSSRHHFRMFIIHARLAIHFSQLMMNFNWCVAFCVQKQNNCGNFALRGSAQCEVHYKRLPSQD